MAYKTNKSPIKQGYAGSIMGNMASQINATQASAMITRQQQPVNSVTNASNTGGLVSGIQNPMGRSNTTSLSGVSPAIAGPGNFANDLSRSTTPRPQTPISPKAFGNTKAIKGMYGKQNPGTFTRNVQGSGSPIMQMEDMAILEDAPQMPPQGVQTNISPTYDLANN
jgi:hypothetical protein